MRFKKNLVLALFILLIYLPACANKQVNNAQNNQNPFAATGLLAHPNETAEEILIRAHAQDLEAVTLVMAGYALGVGGFPKDPWLFTWYDYAAYPVQWEETSMFLLLMYQHAYGPPAKIEPYYCYEASGSFAAPLFRQAEIFNLDAMCAEIGYENKLGGNQDLQKNKELVASIRKELVELIEKPMTKQRAKKLAYLFDSDRTLADFISYHISTAGNNKASKQERILNLLQFIALRKGEPFSESAKLYEVAVNALEKISLETAYKDIALETIRKAHLGDPAAARQMAENYRSGAMGFPQNSYLAKHWLRRSIDGGDKIALDTLALYEYSLALKDSKYPTETTWQDAQVALIYGSPELKSAFSFMIKETEKNFIQEKLHLMQELLNKELQSLKASGYQTK